MPQVDSKTRVTVLPSNIKPRPLVAPDVTMVANNGKGNAPASSILARPPVAALYGPVAALYGPLQAPSGGSVDVNSR